jgi:flagellar motor switch protein FliG
MAEVEYVANLSRGEKAAILVSSLGDELARGVMDSMSPRSAKTLEDQLTSIGPVPPEVVERVTQEFVRFLTAQEGMGGLSQSGPAQISFDDGNEPDLFEQEGGPVQEEMQIEQGEGGKSLSDVLEHMESKVLADFTKGEHPQTIALILAHLDPDKAGEVLSSLPEALQTDVILRLARLETVPSSAVRTVAEALEDQVQYVGTVEKRLGGVKMVASILNQTGRSAEKNILARLEETDPELSDQIKQDMFTFEDLIDVDDRGTQEILKEITSQELAVALKAASEGIKEKIFRNMSERAAEMLNEDIQALGPTRLSDVEKAQQAITRAALRLEGEGKIIVGGRGKEEVLV